MRDHIVLQAFIDGLYNANVRVELRKQKPADIEAALESALHFDAVYRLEPSSATSLLVIPTLIAVELLTQKVDQLMVGQIPDSRSRSFRKQNNQSYRQPNFPSTSKKSSNKHSPSPRKTSGNRAQSGSSTGSRSRSNSRSLSNDRRVRFSGPVFCHGCNRQGHLKSE